MKPNIVEKLLADKKSNLDSTYLDYQNLISKLNLLELLQKYEKYMCLDSNYDTKYYKRIETSLSFIPKKFQVAALTLFSNVFYIGESILSDSLIYLYKELVAYNNLYFDKDKKVIDNMHVFEVDPSGLIEAFFRINKIAGRLDSDTFSRYKSPGEFISSLHTFMCCPDLQKDISLINNIKGVLKKDNWVLLTDFSFSGTSLKSDIRKLQELRDLCFSEEKQPLIMVCAQVIAKKVVIEIQTEFENKGVEIFFSICYDDELRIIPKAVKEIEQLSCSCLLFERNKAIYNKIVSLCEWFGEIYIDRDPAHTETKSKTSRDTLAFGFKDCGFTVVPQRNAPSNSLPILWYVPSEEFKKTYGLDYMPPFPRTISRISQTTSGDKDHLKTLLLSKEAIRNTVNALLQ